MHLPGQIEWRRARKQVHKLMERKICRKGFSATSGVLWPKKVLGGLGNGSHAPHTHTQTVDCWSRLVHDAHVCCGVPFRLLRHISVFAHRRFIHGSFAKYRRQQGGNCHGNELYWATVGSSPDEPALQIPTLLSTEQVEVQTAKRQVSVLLHYVMVLLYSREDTYQKLRTKI